MNPRLALHRVRALRARSRRRQPACAAALALALCLLTAAAGARLARAAPEDPPGPQPTSTPFGALPGSFIDPRLNQPDLPPQPSPADLGAQTWWGVCMACHGDAGQGLTDEWRLVAFGEDRNCWESKCHGPNHPPEGFVFPRIVPPAWGSGTLKRFVTADELQAYLYESMPWWNPGSLSPAEALELANFVLLRHGALPAGAAITARSAGLAPVHLPIRPLTGERGWGLIFGGLIGLAAVGLALQRRRAHAGVSPSAGSPSRPRPSFFHHLHPPTIPAAQARWTHTFGLGGLAVFLALTLTLTGVLELFFYIPTPEDAAQSVQTITFLAPYGGLVRGAHFWAGQALAAVVLLHLLRVIFSGAFAPPRRLNYLIGLALLVLTLLLDFTGYVLRWDEGIRWALLVGTNLIDAIPWVGPALYRFVIGGEAVGAPALQRFYAWHIFGLALAMAVFGAWHIFRVRRDGGIAAPAAERAAPRISRGELVRRETLALLAAAALLALIAARVAPPIAPSIQDSPAALLTESRAPWFFLWVQHLLRLGDAFWMGVALPLAALGVLAALPFVCARQPSDQAGRWFAPGRRLAALLAGGMVLCALILTVLEALQ